MSRSGRIFSLMPALAALVLWGPASVHADEAGGCVAGKWSGAFDIHKADGETENNGAFFILARDGAAVSGSAGMDERHQMPITDGSVTGDRVHFALPLKPGVTLQFDLVCAGDQLAGQAVGPLQPGGALISIGTARLGGDGRIDMTGKSALFREIAGEDQRLFEAYNARDLEKVEGFFSKDLEFYHDKDGVTSYDQNMDAFRRHFAEAATVRRELIQGTLKVYPIAGYGAVETGLQTFYTTEPGQPEQLTATASFTEIWHKTADGWRITRVISYDHH